MNQMDTLQANLDIALGRINALEILLVVIARQLPPELASKCALEATAALNRIEGDLVAAPVADATLEWLRRGVQTGIQVLTAAANQTR